MSVMRWTSRRCFHPAIPDFTEPHFDGWPDVLVRLADVDPAFLEKLITDSYYIAVAKGPPSLGARLPAVRFRLSGWSGRPRSGGELPRVDP